MCEFCFDKDDSTTPTKLQKYVDSFICGFLQSSLESKVDSNIGIPMNLVFVTVHFKEAKYQL